MNRNVTPVTGDQQIAVLAELARDIWNQYFPSIIGQAQVDYMVEKFQSFDAIQSQIASGYEYYLAEINNEPGGYVGLVPNEPLTKLMLSKIYVKDQFRGKGFGTTLLQLAQGRALETGATTIWLTVNRHNHQAINWYKKKGFYFKDEVKTDIGSGFYMDDYIMECGLEMMSWEH
jgi:ribosomal protein S18 acetylase RimI-like enzyme